MRFACCVALITMTTAASAAPTKPPPRPTSVPPLALAAWKPDHAQLRALLAAGEDPNRPSPIGFTPWMWSLLAGDRAGFEMLFQAVRDFRPADSMTETMFLFMVEADQRPLVSLFLERGVSANAKANDGTTALAVAAANGRAAMTALLLDHGADVNGVDQQGDTALMAAVRAGSVETIQTLLARGAKVAPRDKAGHEAMSYAVRSGRQDVQELLRKAGAQAAAPAVTAPPTVQVAVGRSMPLLERTANRWVAEGNCNACHLQPVMMRLGGVARSRGFSVGGPTLDAIERSMRKDHLGPDFGRFASEAIKTEQGVAIASQYVGGDQAFTLATDLAGALDGGLRRLPQDRSSVQLLAKMQQPDGSWRHGPDRVPMQSGDIASTALASRVLAAFGGDDAPARLARARVWMTASVPRSSDEAAFRVLGLRWLDAAPEQVASAAAALIARQLPGGGWSQVEGLNPDAYATGLALVALAEGTGMTGGDPVYRRGVAYLLGTQDADGSWLVHKRSVPVNRYFETGFPHGKAQFSSFVGTAWATMALMYAEPPKRS